MFRLPITMGFVLYGLTNKAEQLKSRSVVLIIPVQHKALIR